MEPMPPNAPYLIKHAYTPVDWTPWEEHLRKPDRRTSLSFYRSAIPPAIGAVAKIQPVNGFRMEIFSPNTSEKILHVH
jgi:hypothetical protein